MHVEACGNGTGEWPEGMTMTFEDNDFELFPLLYSRALWNLTTGLEIPKRLIVEPVRAIEALPSSPGLGDAWESAWDRRLAHLGDLEEFDIEREGLDAYFAAWQESQSRLPPPWQDEFAAWLQNSDYEEWSERVSTILDVRVRPEIQASLVGAWGRGLRNIHLLPLADPFVKPVSERRLVISAATWSSDSQLNEILGSWPLLA